MPAKQYIVGLTEDERKSLNKLTTTGKASARKINHARILLKADINQPDGGCRDQQISEALNISTRSIERVASYRYPFEQKTFYYLIKGERLQLSITCVDKQ